MSEHDIDPQETQEWLDALSNIVEYEGKERATFILQQLVAFAQQHAIQTEGTCSTDYVNSIPYSQQAAYPGNIVIENKILAYLRWNAVMMVLKAGKIAPELGGHIASFASAAYLYEVGFNHFFHAPTAEHGGDLLYTQGHSSPGIYARAYLEGRLTENQLKNFRQEICIPLAVQAAARRADDVRAEHTQTYVSTDGEAQQSCSLKSAGYGLSSYPHPWLMPDFWQFATVSMGLGPLMAIYQARFLKYLENRGLVRTAKRKVWVFCGDGEMDEPESLGAIGLASREQLDNLIFVINCNLQRLDGPVRGNSKIIQELESIFRGAGWHVIKVIWSSEWDTLLANDKSGLLKKRMMEVIDGEYQSYSVHGPAYFREHFFGKYPELLALVAHLSDEELKQLHRGGHDAVKVYAAYAQAVAHQGQPTVILAKTVKGFGMGTAGEGQNITHQKKKLTTEDLKHLRERFNIPVSDEDIEQLKFVKPAENSEEINYLKEKRAALGGFLPQRQHQLAEKLPIPPLSTFQSLLENTGDREISTTMAFVRFLSTLLKDKTLGSRIVPIVPDESRTFGMEGLFRQIGIYSPHGQLYSPEDAKQIMYYREATDGQILEEGINEAGAFASWIAAGTSYSTNQFSMIPFYIYYSMFGFQRIGDFAWAAGDMQTRGFLLGATAGRTTLAGEGLQHQDGHSHLLANTIPNCVSYDPTYAYELAVIMQHGLQRMIGNEENVFFYITLMNENYTHPAMPENAQEGIIRGMYLLKKAEKAKLTVQLLGSGTILNEVIRAADYLWQEHQIAADIWSVTSFNELRRDGLSVERHNRLQPHKPRKAYVTTCLEKQPGPVIAATDYMKLYADQIRPFIPNAYTVLGTDGYGRSDTRVKLREFFEVNWQMIAYTALHSLFKEGKIPQTNLQNAVKKLNIHPDKPEPTMV